MFRKSTGSGDHDHPIVSDSRHRSAVLGTIGVGLLYVAVMQVALINWWPTPKPNPLPAPVATRGGQSDGLGGQVAARDDSHANTPYRDSKSAPTTAKLASVSTITRPSGPPHSIRRDKTRQLAIVDDKSYPLRTYQTAAQPNDPLSNQWWVSNTHMDQAWGVPAGNTSTTLAIIDTGFALKHEEFANRLYTNAGESGSVTSEAPSELNCHDQGLPLDASCNLIDDDADGIVDNESGAADYQNPSRLNCTDQGKPLDKSCNRIDDDGNGFVDDVTGWDFANNDNLPQAGELNPTGAGTTHGTRTMGVAAATGNNGKGIAGVDWKTKILPIQALDDDSYGDTLGVGRAIYYAAEQHANVISLSLGSDLPDDFVRQAIAYATEQGSVVVAASGNDGCNCMIYPANYPETLAVGALDTTGQPASFSSYGANLDIMAPGVSITSANWTASNGTSSYAGNLAGTSFATPMVAGLVSRMHSQQPNATPLQLIAALTENTNRLGLSANTARSNSVGYGGLDAYKASQRMATSQFDSQLYQFTPVSWGNTYTPAQPLEAAGSYIPRSCANNAPGSTPLYQLTKNGSTFFTISPTENWLTQGAGFQSQFVTTVCLSQPQDTATVIRPINLFGEIRNIVDR